MYSICIYSTIYTVHLDKNDVKVYICRNYFKVSEFVYLTSLSVVLTLFTPSYLLSKASGMDCLLKMSTPTHTLIFFMTRPAQYFVWSRMEGQCLCRQTQERREMGWDRKATLGTDHIDVSLARDRACQPGTLLNSCRLCFPNWGLYSTCCCVSSQFSICSC